MASPIDNAESLKRQFTQDERRPIGHLMNGSSLRVVAHHYRVPLATMHRKVKRMFQAVTREFDTKGDEDAEVQQA